MRPAAFCVVIVAILSAACSKHATHLTPTAPATNGPPTAADIFDPKLNPDAIVGKFLDPRKMTPSEVKYGIAPKRDPRVSYAPDVILMEQGDQAIKDAGRDGMTWSFDAKAPHVSEFAEGKIVFATGRAVGRIGQVTNNGTSVTVKLAPVQITDVIKDGHFIVDSDVDLRSMITYEAPDFPSIVDVGAAAAKTTTWQRAFGKGSGYLVHTGYFRTLQGLPSGLGSLDPPVQAPPALTDIQAATNVPRMNLNDALMVVPLAGSDTSVGLDFSYNKNGLHVDAGGKLVLANAHIKFALDIQNFHVTTFGMTLGGATGLIVALQVWSDKDRFVNVNQFAELPADISLPIPIGGVPLALTFHTSFNFNSAFSAKQSIMTATGEYGISGEVFVGVKDGRPSAAPDLHPYAKTEIASSVKGVSVGINSMVVGISVRPMIGIGAFGFNTGVFVGVDFSGSVLKQSDIVLSQCRGGYMHGSLDSGVGYQLPGPLIKIINGILSVFTKYKIPGSGTLIPGPHPTFMDLSNEIPKGCATPR